MKCTSRRLFLQASHRKDSANIPYYLFFLDQVLGKNHFTRIVKNMCINDNIKGNGTNEYVTIHGLRGSMASLLLETGFSSVDVDKRTGHRGVNTLMKYKYLQSETGIAQQRSLFEGIRGIKHIYEEDINKNELSTEEKKVRYDQKVSFEHSQCMNEKKS